MSERRVVGSSTEGAPTAGSYTVGDFVLDVDGTVWKCTVAGTPGTWVVQAHTGDVVGNVTGELNAAKLDTNATGVGFYGAAPAAQPAAVADAAGGTIIDIEARAALNALLARLRTLGLIAT